MLITIKNDLLHKYNLKADKIKSPVTFIEIDKERKFDENSDNDEAFNYIQFEDGCIVFGVISEFLEFAKNYYELFKSYLFNDTAFEYLFEFITGRMVKYNIKPYTNYQELHKYMRYYFSDNNYNYNNNSSKIQESTIQFKADTPYKNITDSYTELSQDCLYYGTLIDNNIVSIVGTNTPILKYTDVDVVDIGVETHTDFRQKGYAVSNVAAMTDYLHNNGYIVKYGCNNKNVYSNKTAVLVGLKEKAIEKTVFVYKN